MVRTLTGIGFALALVGSAHAQDTQVTVSLAGKSQHEVRLELQRAAEKVCASNLNALDTSCVEDAYVQALQDLKAAQKADHHVYAEASAARLH